MFKFLIFKKVKYNSIKFFTKVSFIAILIYPFVEYKVYSNNLNSNLDKSYLNRKNENPYILGPGDLISIKLSEIFPELAKIYRIDGSGRINDSRVGNLYVEGLTIDELENLLNDKYDEIMFNTDISVKIKEYRNIRVQIRGEVYSPGLVNLKGQGDFLLELPDEPEIINNSENLLSKTYASYINFPTLYDAIRGAGGITLNSDLTNIEIIRKNSISNGGGLIKTNVNFSNFLINQGANSNIRLFDGDIISIKKSNNSDKSMLLKAMATNLNPKIIEVVVTGRIENEGLYKLSRASTLNDAIEFAGGQLPISGKITLGRINGDGSVTKQSIRYKKSSKRGSESNPYLMQGDIVNVGSNKFNKASTIINEVTAPISGLVNAYYLYKVFD